MKLNWTERLRFFSAFNSPFLKLQRRAGAALFLPFLHSVFWWWRWRVLTNTLVQILPLNVEFGVNLDCKSQSILLEHGTTALCIDLLWPNSYQQRRAAGSDHRRGQGFSFSPKNVLNSKSIFLHIVYLKTIFFSSSAKFLLTFEKNTTLKTFIFIFLHVIY